MTGPDLAEYAISLVIRDVCELPDDYKDDDPSVVRVSTADLQVIIRRHFSSQPPDDKYRQALTMFFVMQKLYDCDNLRSTRSQVRAFSGEPDFPTLSSQPDLAAAAVTAAGEAAPPSPTPEVEKVLEAIDGVDDDACLLTPWRGEAVRVGDLRAAFSSLFAARQAPEIPAAVRDALWDYIKDLRSSARDHRIVGNETLVLQCNAKEEAIRAFLDGECCEDAVLNECERNGCTLGRESARQADAIPDNFETPLYRIVRCGCRQREAPYGPEHHPEHEGKVGRAVLGASTGWAAIKWGEEDGEICTADVWVPETNDG
jgi:hypothetical protein